MKGEGYYIAPSGDIIELDTSHIDLIIKHPEKFLMTKREVEDTYKKYNEPLGTEGKAREEILSKLLKSNWIRIRHIPKTDSFTVQVNRLDKRKKDQIAAFANEAIHGLRGRQYHSNTDVKVMDLSTNLLGSWTLDALSKDVLYKEAKVISITQYNPRRANIIKRVLEKLQ